MRRIGLAVVLAACLTLAPHAGKAQQAGRAYRIGYVGTPAPSAAFLAGLRDLGYVDGRNFAIDYRSSHGDVERLVDVIAELIRVPVAVIVTSGTPATLAAKRAAATVPVVMVGVGDPVEAGIVSSYVKPGGNITGMGGFGPELEAKRLSILKEVLPKLSRVAVFVNPDMGVYAAQLRAVRIAADALSLIVKEIPVRDAADLEPAFGEAVSARAQAVLVFRDPLMLRHRREVVQLAARHRVPGMFGSREIAEAGGLIFYGEDLAATFRRTASYVDKILKGAKPADLPVEQPTKFELVINLKTAKALGLTIPPPVLGRADHVIE